MRAGIRFHFFAIFLGHTRSVAQAYARGLRMRHPRGIHGLGKALNFIFLQFQMFLFGILGRLVVQSQKDSNIDNYLFFSSTQDKYLQWSLDGTSEVNCAFLCLTLVLSILAPMPQLHRSLFFLSIRENYLRWSLDSISQVNCAFPCWTSVLSILARMPQLYRSEYIMLRMGCACLARELRMVL